jgi:hypothetical protein
MRNCSTAVARVRIVATMRMRSHLARALRCGTGKITGNFVAIPRGVSSDESPDFPDELKSARRRGAGPNSLLIRELTGNFFVTGYQPGYLRSASQRTDTGHAYALGGNRILRDSSGWEGWCHCVIFSSPICEANGGVRSDSVRTDRREAPRRWGRRAIISPLRHRARIAHDDTSLRASRGGGKMLCTAL